MSARAPALSERVSWALLAVAMLLAAALILYLNRGTTFFIDQLTWVLDAPELTVRDVIEPHNGHLLATTMLTYKLVLETVGIDYLTFRLLGVLALLTSTGLLYVLAARRIGSLPALAPAIVLLFLGSASQHVAIPIGFTAMLAIAAGLGALLALERHDLAGDLAACALLVLSVATFSIGLAFVVGVAVSILLAGDRWRRAWVFAVPLALYATWWVYSLQAEVSSETQTTVANVVLVPSYVADSLAAVLAALLGLGYSFADPSGPLELGWGRVLAVIFVVALALRVLRGGVPGSMWAGIAIALTFWSLGAIAYGESFFFREPWQSRFIYTGSVMVLLVATAAAAGLRPSRAGIAVLFAVAAFSLATNLALLRDGAASFRDDYSAPLRAQFAMLELAGDRAPADFDPVAELPPEVAPMSSPAGRYLVAVDRYGSPAFTLEELAGRDEATRRGADRVLVAALGIELTPADDPEPDANCETVAPGSPGEAVELEVPPGGLALRAEGEAEASVVVGRFAGEPAAEIDGLGTGEWAALRVEPDEARRPWRAAVSGASSVSACPLHPSGIS